MELKAQTIIPTISVCELSWNEWKERWAACTDLITAKGLLHAIFDTNMGTEFHPEYLRNISERVCLLLEIADGHMKYPHTPDREIRVEAFTVLATKFFRKNNYDSIQYLDSKTRENLIWFFRGPEDKHGYHTLNISLGITSSTEFPMKMGKLYLDAFCDYTWREDRFPSAVRASILEIYYVYRRLSTLAGSVHNNKWQLFTDDMAEKLNELALRDAASVDEGVLIGSEAATLLSLVRIARSEIERQQKRKSLQTSLAETTAALAKL